MASHPSIYSTIGFSLALAIGIASGPAQADTDGAPDTAGEAITRADLNMRSGPGTDNPVVEVIPEGETVRVRGCLEDFGWCAIEAEAGLGWVSAKFLQTRYFGRPFMVRDVGERIGIPVVLYDPTVEGQIVGRDGPLPDQASRPGTDTNMPPATGSVEQP